MTLTSFCKYPVKEADTEVVSPRNTQSKQKVTGLALRAQQRFFIEWKKYNTSVSQFLCKLKWKEWNMPEVRKGIMKACPWLMDTPDAFIMEVKNILQHNFKL